MEVEVEVERRLLNVRGKTEQSSRAAILHLLRLGFVTARARNLTAPSRSLFPLSVSPSHFSHFFFAFSGCSFSPLLHVSLRPTTLAGSTLHFHYIVFAARFVWLAFHYLLIGSFRCVHVCFRFAETDEYAVFAEDAIGVAFDLIWDKEAVGTNTGKSMSNRRWMRWAWGLVVIASLISLGASVADFGDDTLVSRIAFGSCANQSAPQPIWNAIINFNPQLFIWLGDNIYGDIRRPFKFFGKERTIGPWKNVPRFIPASEQEMEYRYKIAKTNPGYLHLRQNAKVIGTWDDHDYGLNDAGKEFSEKVTNQRLLLDFLDEPDDSPRRKQAGVYTSYTYGPTGKQVKVILLDTRYHRDPLFSDGSILGSSQWEWLEKELKGSKTEITIIGSSIQVISNLSATTGPLFYLEAWGRFPRERERLFKLIRESKRDGVLFISGDVHFGEISRYDCGAGYPLFDITSSGLTQSVENAVPCPLHMAMRFMAWFTPNTMRVMSNYCKYSSCTFGQPNFGAIEIHWDENPVKLRIEVRDIYGHPVTSANVSLSELRADNAQYRDANAAVGYKRHCSLEVSLPWIIRYRLAILVYGALTVTFLAFLGLAYKAGLFCSKCLHKYKLD